MVVAVADTAVAESHTVVTGTTDDPLLVVTMVDDTTTVNATTETVPPLLAVAVVTGTGPLLLVAETMTEGALPLPPVNETCLPDVAMTASKYDVLA